MEYSFKNRGGGKCGPSQSSSIVMPLHMCNKQFDYNCTEIELILQRADMDMQSDIMALTICPTHRDRFGTRWKTNCTK